jgi:hypothetical protein
MKINLQNIYDTKRRIRHEHISTLQGILNCGLQPKYKQIGTPFIWHPGYFYFCVKVEKATGLEQLEDTIGLEVFATVEWGGQVQRTRSISDASIPVFNEIFYFMIPLNEAQLTDEIKLAEALRNELQTKCRVGVTLWRRYYSGALKHLGSAWFNVGNVNGCKPDDVFFTTEDRHVIIYETRVFSKNLTLSSAFDADLLANIAVKAWFFKELPCTVDLAPFIRDTDELPPEVVPGMKDLTYDKKWQGIVGEVYEVSDVSRDVRKFDVMVQDHCKYEHFLPLFLSAISPPDQGSIDVMSRPYDHKIRTVAEVAHYVRCVPFAQSTQRFWVSPNGTLAMRCGTVNDHALLLASLFLACNYEEFSELERKFAFIKRKAGGRTAKKKQSKKNTLDYFEDLIDNVAANQVLAMEEEPPGLRLEKAAKDAKEAIKETLSVRSSRSAKRPPPPTMSAKDKPAKEQGTTGEAPTQSQAPAEPEEEETVLEPEGEGEEEKDLDEIPLANRVFVCLGTDRIKKSRYAWVMTIDKNGDKVTFWDPQLDKRYDLPARVKNKELLLEFLKYKSKPLGTRDSS